MSSGASAVAGEEHPGSVTRMVLTETARERVCEELPHYGGQEEVDRVVAAIGERLNRNYGDSIGGVSRKLLSDIDITNRLGGTVLGAIADADPVALTDGCQLCVEQRGEGTRARWRITTRDTGGES